jgi:hypothetical protein
MDGLMGQRQHGTPLSERDCFERAIHHATGLRDSVRGLALLRAGDKNHAFGWLTIVQVLDQLIDNIKKLMVRGVNRTPLILPARFRE